MLTVQYSNPQIGHMNMEELETFRSVARIAKTIRRFVL